MRHPHADAHDQDYDDALTNARRPGVLVDTRKEFPFETWSNSHEKENVLNNTDIRIEKDSLHTVR